jgi:dienelactone hydrolase
MDKAQRNLLGEYGPWVDNLVRTPDREYSFLNKRWTDAEEWSTHARRRVETLLAPPDIDRLQVQVDAKTLLDGVEVEELSWSLPYGPVTHAYFLKPAGASGKFSAVLALHDHGANKFFGKQKIADARPQVHPFIREYRKQYYGGRAWANELAKRGYAVLVPDVFLFESRRMTPSLLPGLVVERTMQAHGELRELVPEDMDEDRVCTTYDIPLAERAIHEVSSAHEAPSAHEVSSAHEASPDHKVSTSQIEAYNAFAAQYEATIAKSLVCAGLSWPGVVLAEDRAALDYLSSRPDVDADRIGCGGLSGGGLRTNLLAGMDPRIRCSFTTGFMTTWADFALHTAYTHTWMAYIAGLPRLMDYPELLALRAPLPALVQASRQDPLYTNREVAKAQATLEAIYRKAGAADHFRMSYHEGPHRFDIPMQEEAFGWLDSWLE